METNDLINAGALLEEIKITIEDDLIVVIRKCNDGLLIKFPTGQTFTLAFWENKK